MFKTAMDKVLIGFTVVIALFMAFSTGVNTQAGQWLNALSSAISGAFFVGIVWAVVAGRIATLKDEARIAAFKEIEPALDKIVAAAESALKAAEAVAEDDDDLDEHTQMLSHALLETIKFVTKGEKRVPTPEEVLEIQRKFSEVVPDHSVKLTVEDHGIAAEFMRIGGRIPVSGLEDEGRAVATHVAPEGKKLSKSQQRRINAQKGLGALTDDEVKEARNEKRRQARAAKKAAETKAEPTLKEKVAQQN